MNKTDYYLMRRTKKIKLKQIADYIGCSIAHLSKFENNLVNMSDDKVRKYQEYIENYNEKELTI